VEPAKRTTVFRWDLDKTYLRTDFDRLRELVRVPFQTAADKVDVPGVVELVRSLKDTAKREGRQALVYFISASPPQIGDAIREKFVLDGVEVDGIVFKDQLQILLRGRLRGLREQVGFKLTELLRGRLAAPPEAREFLFGDDWEADPIIYSIYADLIAGRLGPDVLGEILSKSAMDREWRAQIDAMLPALVPRDAVVRIFINLERSTPPGSFRGFGPRLVPTFNYFQTAACLFEEGELDLEGVERVGRALIARDAYSLEMLENSLGDLLRRDHLAPATFDRLAEECRRRGLFPRRRTPLRRRIAERARRWLGRRNRPAGPPERRGAALDYVSMVESWRGEP
jgi:hypothetical protein